MTEVALPKVPKLNRLLKETETAPVFIPELGLWERKTDSLFTEYTTYSLDEQGKIRHRTDGQPAVIGIEHGSTVVSFMEWYENGLLHRDWDLPAHIGSKGDKVWFKHGLIHRDSNQPAVVDPDGSCEFYVDGLRHNETGPAVVNTDGCQYWYLHGELARKDGGPTHIDSLGTQAWSFTRSDHRGFPIEMLHNTKGPAVIHPDGTVEYWLAGNLVTKQIIDNLNKDQK